MTANVYDYPVSVTVVFPANTGGSYVVTVLGTGTPGHAGTQLIHSAALAQFAGGVNPVNAAELQALAAQTAADWFAWRLASLEIRFESVVAWNPSGMEDVEYTDNLTTAIHRSTWTPESAAFLQQAGTFGSSPLGSVPVTCVSILDACTGAASYWNLPSAWQTAACSPCNPGGGASGTWSCCPSAPNFWTTIGGGLGDETGCLQLDQTLSNMQQIAWTSSSGATLVCSVAGTTLTLASGVVYSASSLVCGGATTMTLNAGATYVCNACALPNLLSVAITFSGPLNVVGLGTVTVPPCNTTAWWDSTVGGWYINAVFDTVSQTWSTNFGSGVEGSLMGVGGFLSCYYAGTPPAGDFELVFNGGCNLAYPYTSYYQTPALVNQTPAAGPCSGPSCSLALALTGGTMYFAIAGSPLAPTITLAPGTCGATPGVAYSDAPMCASASTLTVDGTGFTPAGNTIALNLGAAGTLAYVSSTQATLTFTTTPTSPGALRATITNANGTSTPAVQIAYVESTAAPTVTSSTAPIPQAAATFTFHGTGFDPILSRNTVTLSSGTYTATACTSTSMTVTFTAPPSLGSLTATVTTACGGASGTFQVGTVQVLVRTLIGHNQVADGVTVTLAPVTVQPGLLLVYVTGAGRGPSFGGYPVPAVTFDGVAMTPGINSNASWAAGQYYAAGQIFWMQVRAPTTGAIVMSDQNGTSYAYAIQAELVYGWPGATIGTNADNSANFGTTGTPTLTVTLGGAPPWTGTDNYCGALYTLIDSAIGTETWSGSPTYDGGGQDALMTSIPGVGGTPIASTECRAATGYLTQAPTCVNSTSTLSGVTTVAWCAVVMSFYSN